MTKGCWHVLIPGDGVAMDWTGETEADVRASLRWFFGYKRLPRGTQIWERDLDEQRWIDESNKRGGFGSVALGG